MKLFRTVAMALAGLAVLVGGAATAATGSNGSISGRLELVGGPYPGIHRGVPGTIRFVGPQGQTFNTTASKHGRFTDSLPPGKYLVTGQATQLGSFTCRAEHPVTLQAHEDVHHVL